MSQNKVHPENSIKHNPSFHSSFKLIYILTRLIGIMPLTTSVQNGKPILVSKKSDIIYFIVFFVITTVSSSFSLRSVYIGQVDYYIMPTKLIFLQYCIYVGLFYTTICCGFTYRNLLINAHKILTNVDDSLADMNTYIKPNKISKTINAIILWMFTSIFIRGIFSMKAIKFDLIITLGWFPSAYVKSLSKYTFIALIMPILARFSKINNLLKESFLTKDEDFISQRIKTLCLMHFKLCNVTRMYNTTFAFILLASLTATLSDFLFELYYLYIALTKKYEFTHWWMFGFSISWLTDDVVEIYLLVRACVLTSFYANLTPIIMHQLRNKIDSPLVARQILTYSLQMLHQKVRFSAAGFFPIDYTLMYSIGGAVFGYMVIFIQFDQKQTQNVICLNNTTTTGFI